MALWEAAKMAPKVLLLFLKLLIQNQERVERDSLSAAPPRRKEKTLSPVTLSFSKPKPKPPEKPPEKTHPRETLVALLGQIVGVPDSRRDELLEELGFHAAKLALEYCAWRTWDPKFLTEVREQMLKDLALLGLDFRNGAKLWPEVFAWARHSF